MNASSTILLSNVPASTQARLRSVFQQVEFTIVPGGRVVREILSQPQADAAIVNVDGDVERSFHLVRELAAGGVRVLVVGPVKDPDLILRSMREGAKEFVLAGDDEEILRVLREQVKPPGADGGRVYAVFPAKGGVGATTLATNLGGALQRLGERTCLVDLDLDMGDVLAFLDLAGGYSIAETIASMRRLDRELLDSTLLKHASGVYVLAQSHRIGQAETVEPAQLTALLGFMRSHYGAVVLDGLRSFDELAVAALDAADRILLVVTQEVPAVRDARRCVDLLGRLGARDRLRLVVNRFQKGNEITPAVISDTVGLPVAATVANDYPAVIRAINRGHLVLDESLRSQVAKDVQRLVGVVGHAARAEGSSEKPSLLRRFLSPRMSHAT